MPTISRFFGIVISLNYNDHNPPHFHITYGEYDACFAIQSASLMTGWLPGKAEELVTAWAVLHQDEVRENWYHARENRPLRQIPPLC